VGGDETFSVGSSGGNGREPAVSATTTAAPMATIHGNDPASGGWLYVDA
jgi:hypothetical protein